MTISYERKVISSGRAVSGMFAGLIIVASLSLLPGCGLFGGKEVNLPVAPAPTRVALTIDVAKDVNPDASGQGAPLQLRLYELRGSSAFQAADFFAIYDKDQVALGGDLVGKKELVVQPGDRKVLMLEPAAGSQNIGVFAAYRQLDNARWRAVAAVIPQRTSVVEIKITGTRMTLETPPVVPLNSSPR